MGYSDEMYKRKRIELEQERIEVEKTKTKLLADIRDMIGSMNVTLLGDLAVIAVNPKTDMIYKTCKKALEDTQDGIEERWKE